MGYNPWGLKESNMSEQLSIAHKYMEKHEIVDLRFLVFLNSNLLMFQLAGFCC